MRRGRVSAVVGVSAALFAGGLAIAQASSPLTLLSPASPIVAGLSGLTAGRDLGRASGTVHIQLLLAGRDTSALDALVAHPHAAVSPAQFLARFSPSEPTVAATAAWARSRGLRVDSVSADRLLVSLSGSAATVGSAFGTTLHRVLAANGATFTSPTHPGHLPSGLTGLVRAVVGLTDLKMATSASATPAAVTTVNPPLLSTFYDVGATPKATTTSLGIITQGDLTHVLTDLQAFEAKWGLPTVVPTVVQTGAPSADTSGQLEFDLDTQYSTAMAGTVKSLYLYNTPTLGSTDLDTAIDRLVTDNKVTVASMSIGTCELAAQLVGMRAADDAILQEAVAANKTLFTSSDDGGILCNLGLAGISTLAPGVDYPASSPFAVGVGGTTITSIGAGGTGQESAWSGSGGGISLVESRPGFQAHAGGTNLGINRGVPDVALDSDPATGYEVIHNGSPVIVGGTSAAAPSWAGFWARAQTLHGGTLGYANPILYALARDFHDITSGGNPLPATAGWDYATGLGTPDVAKLAADA